MIVPVQSQDYSWNLQLFTSTDHSRTLLTTVSTTAGTGYLAGEVTQITFLENMNTW